MSKRCKHIKVVQAICGQILAYQISEFPIDVDQLPKYGEARVTQPIVFIRSFLSMAYFFLDSLLRNQQPITVFLPS